MIGYPWLLRSVAAVALSAALSPNLEAQGTMQRSRYTDAYGSREYVLYRPTSPSAAAKALVVMLHGCTQTADDFARGTRMNEAADREGFMVLYPEQPQGNHPQKCWNWYAKEQVTRDHGEVALLAGLVDSVARAEGIPASRVAMVGMSAGGAMAANFAAAYPERIAALAVHSGIPALAALDLPTALKTMHEGAAESGSSAAVLEEMGARLRALPVIAIHGADDKVVSPVNMDRLAEQWLTVNARASQPLVPVERHLVRGVGHAWSGGASAGTYTAPTGPDATQMIVDFLLRAGAIGH